MAQRSTNCLLLTALLTLTVSSQAAVKKQPHIINIIADDLGWNDIGFHGSNQVPTPNIDALAYNGIILHNYYVLPLCTPTRTALLTGKYPIRTGLQSLVLFSAEPRGLPLEEKLLPQYLQDLGYRTHLSGKWHLGHYTKEYTPTYRGFETHLGYWSGHIDHYDYTALERQVDPRENQSIVWLGLDIRRGMDVAYDLQGQYATDFITTEAIRVIKEHNSSQPLYLQIAHAATHAGNVWDPMQAPPALVAQFKDIKDVQRRKFAAMLSALDNSVGAVVQQLQDSGLLDNSIILFTSDNGGISGPVEGNEGSNYPLRGMKNTMWEGGVRAVGAIWSPLLRDQGRISRQLIHVSDWLPTFYAAAGGKVADLGQIDGVNQWNALSKSTPSARKGLLVNIDEYQGTGAILEGDWKYVENGSNGNRTDGWYGATGRDIDYDYSPTQVTQSTTAKVLARHNKLGLSLRSSEVRIARDELTVNCSPLLGRTTCTTCLFNLKVDPCEQNNLAAANPLKLQYLKDKLNKYKQEATPPSNTQWDIRGHPSYWNNTWTNFGDYI